MPVKTHYDNHLGNFYSWMTGNLDERQREHQQIFKELGISAGNGLSAMDLGSGHGIQSIALAALGFDVLAVDFNRQLLDELSVSRKSYPIRIYQQDIFVFLETESLTANVIVCMGDTITHFQSVSRLRNFFKLIVRRLRSKGSVVISFRDLTTELKGASRFIPVKSDADKILTCFLEYFSDHVMVHDLLWEKTPDGWKQTVSAYSKLRLSEKIVADLMLENGLTVTKSFVKNGMIYILAHSVTH